MQLELGGNESAMRGKRRGTRPLWVLEIQDC